MTRTAPPRVTVVIPAFNAQAYIAEAIASIQAQTLSDWQLIVVDDGSSDQTLAVAREAAGDDPRIRLVRLERNAGIARASNTGFDAAQGEFIARLDADDRALPQRLALQVEAFRDNPRLMAIGSSARLFGGADGVAPAVMGDANLKARLGWSPNTIGGSNMMVRRAFIQTHQIRFDESLRSAEDLDYLRAIIAAGGELANREEVLYECRLHPSSFTQSREDVGRDALQAVRQRLLGLWYPALDAQDIAWIVAMFLDSYAAESRVLLETVRAIDRLLKATPQDFGQDTTVVHGLILERLPVMAALYREHGLLDASHLQAIRCFCAPALSDALDAAKA